MAARESSHEGLRIEVSGPTALGDAVAAARRYASDQGLGSRDAARLCIIVEELIANMLEHGGGDIDRRIGVELTRLDGGVSLAIEDDGPPFDPRSVSDAIETPDRGGGAGLRLVHAWSTIVDYQAEGGRNRLELEMPLTGR